MPTRSAGPSQGETLTVLVLGVGGNVSQGILKALSLSSLRCRVIAACTSPGALGLFTADAGYVSPPARAPNFVPWLVDVCGREGIHAVLSGVEPVLDVLLSHAAEIQRQTGAICIANAIDAVMIGRDKLRTCAWLRDHGFNYPAFAASNDAGSLLTLVNDVGFPLLAKPRLGKGSGGVFVVQDRQSLDRVAGLSDYVIEEYLGDESSEYTASCFTDRNDLVRGVIVFHRELQHGTTIAASAGLFPEIRRESEAIAAALKPRGPLNIQMRMHRGRPVCFEMNVRFSGTTPMRARLGFNDVEAALRHYVLDEPAQGLPIVTRGNAIRYWNEMYVDTQAMESLVRDHHLAEPRESSVTLEDYGQKK